jgi:hypothetical protein
MKDDYVVALTAVPQERVPVANTTFCCEGGDYSVVPVR